LGNDQAMASPGKDGAVEIMIRPENVRVDEKRSGPALTLRATLIDQVFQGSFLKLSFIDEAGRPLTAALAESERTRSFTLGDTFDISWENDRTMVFDKDAA
ncbi:MAG TPA: TOBE domain-containing protein, partial [Nordella sp.]|nr:TOBE domain-containing protein [Nordella sp.]